MREALEAENRAFESALSKVGDEHWDPPTSRGEWDVGALVNHVLLGTRISIQILDGMPRDEIIAGLNDDMLEGEHRSSRGLQPVGRSDVPGIRRTRWPGRHGCSPRRRLPSSDVRRVTDGADHAWDLGHAMGAEPTLDGEMLEFLWADSEPKQEMLTATGMFGDVDSGFTYARFVWARHCAAG